jgi:hypothetical protein
MRYRKIIKKEVEIGKKEQGNSANTLTPIIETHFFFSPTHLFPSRTITTPLLPAHQHTCVSPLLSQKHVAIRIKGVYQCQ